MNIIDWTKYVDHIFCMTYLPSNRLNEISKTLMNVNIDINNPKFFSFIYDYEHKIFLNEYDNMRQKSYEFININLEYDGMKLKKPYIFDVALSIYRTLKIAQYFNYNRIILFEDDIIFLKDLNYIIKAMDFLKTQNFDMCICQSIFCDTWRGIKSYLKNEEGCEDLGNDMFMKTNDPLGIYDAGFNILTKDGINKIVKLFEDHNIVSSLDVLIALKKGIINNFNICFALKPLCIQKCMLDLDINFLQTLNANINIKEYIE